MAADARDRAQDDGVDTERSDLKLYETAWNKEWPVSQAVRKQMLQRVVNVLDDVETSPRLVVAAFRAIAAATGHNIRREAVEVQQRQLEHHLTRDGSGRGDAIDRDVIREAEQLASDRRAERAADGATSELS